MVPPRPTAHKTRRKSLYPGSHTNPPKPFSCPDFRSESDSALGPTVSEALRTDLAQSTQLRVLTRASLREILGLMQRPDESRVPFDLAREIATREGAKAVLDGNIVRLGQSYVVSARLVSSRDGAELATFRETAANEDQLITALGAMSRSIREKAGESLRTIRASSALERVTTPSLPALRKYVEGSAMADGWMGRLYPWETEIDVSSLEPGDYTFVSRTDDPSGGEGPGPMEDSKAITIG